MNAIEIKNLTKVYQSGAKALNEVNLTIKQGDFFALLGANGAGKSTLINILTGLVSKSSGEAKIFDFDITKDSENSKRMVGLVPQEFNFSVFEKVIDILCTYAGYFGVERKDAEIRAEEILNKLGLWDKHNQPAMTLSGGMKRRLMIARALMHKPQLLILDEPTAGVDIELRHEMWDYLVELNNSGTTILLTTHYLEEAEQLCKNIAILKKGVIVKNGSIKELLQHMDSQTYILTVNNIKNLQDFFGNGVIKCDDNTIEVTIENQINISEFILELNKKNVAVLDIKPKNNRLEQLYLSLLKS